MNKNWKLFLTRIKYDSVVINIASITSGCIYLWKVDKWSNITYYIYYMNEEQYYKKYVEGAKNAYSVDEKNSIIREAEPKYFYDLWHEAVMVDIKL
jgi:hypothetical protein